MKVRQQVQTDITQSMCLSHESSKLSQHKVMWVLTSLQPNGSGLSLLACTFCRWENGSRRFEQCGSCIVNGYSVLKMNAPLSFETQQKSTPSHTISLSNKSSELWQVKLFGNIINKVKFDSWRNKIKLRFRKVYYHSFMCEFSLLPAVSYGCRTWSLQQRADTHRKLGLDISDDVLVRTTNMTTILDIVHTAENVQNCGHA